MRKVKLSGKSEVLVRELIKKMRLPSKTTKDLLKN